MMKIAHGGVTVGQVDHPFRQPHRFGRLATFKLGGQRTVDQPKGQRRVADRLEQVGEFGSQLRCFAESGVNDQCRQPPGHPHSQRHLVAGGAGEVTQLVEAGVGQAAAGQPGAGAEQRPR